MEMSWRSEGDPRIYYRISQEISEHIPEDLLEYPKKISEDLGDPQRSSEILGYPRISFLRRTPRWKRNATFAVILSIFEKDATSSQHYHV